MPGSYDQYKDGVIIVRPPFSPGDAISVDFHPGLVLKDVGFTTHTTPDQFDGKILVNPNTVADIKQV